MNELLAALTERVAALTKRRESLGWARVAQREVPDSAFDAIDREIAELQPKIARAEVCAVLQPRSDFWRPFLKRLSDHAVDLTLEHRLLVQRALSADMCARQTSRTIYTPPVMTEPVYAGFLHEVGHVVDPHGSGWQHRFDDTGKSLVSPLAEVFSWAFAVENALVWTAPMQEELVRGLSSYQSHAIPEERDAIIRMTAAGFDAVQPAPDTPEGRKAIVKRIEWEQKMLPRRRKLWAMGLDA
jgi:hypothetical protein